VPNDDETLYHPEQPRFLFSAWMWAVVLFVFFGVIVAIAFGAMQRGSTFEQDRAKARAEKLKTAGEEATKTLTSYGWVDKGKGVAHIPIDRAMELALADLQSRQPAPAGPIATPDAGTQLTATGAPQPGNPPNAPAASTSATPAPVSVEGLNSQIRGQPTGAANPPPAQPGTQPGASATPAAVPQTHSEMPPVSPTVTPKQSPPGTPIPVAGKTPPPPKR
jgi:hypothetical protein